MRTVTSDRFVVMASGALPSMWSVFDNARGWVWQGFTNQASAQAFKERLEGASDKEYKRLRGFKPGERNRN
jgi:hypothetical protein